MDEKELDQTFVHLYFYIQFSKNKYNVHSVLVKNNASVSELKELFVKICSFLHKDQCSDDYLKKCLVYSKKEKICCDESRCVLDYFLDLDIVLFPHTVLTKK